MRRIPVTPQLASEGASSVVHCRLDSQSSLIALLEGEGRLPIPLNVGHTLRDDSLPAPGPPSEMPATQPHENGRDHRAAPSPDRLYAHWLDGEWHKIARSTQPDPTGFLLSNSAESALMLHALLGTRLVISDVQLTDSPVLVKLFCDEAFRSYLELDPGFLTLAADPSNASDLRRGIATSGLARAIKTGWKTSLPGVDTGLIRDFAREILDLPDLNAVRCLEDASRGPGRLISRSLGTADTLEGILRGVCYFATAPSAVVAPVHRSSRTYFDFLETMATEPSLNPIKRDALTRTLYTVAGLVRHEDRGTRSALVTAMEGKLPRERWPREYHECWNTVVHAWNENIRGRLGATRSSISRLPHAEVAFRGEISDVAGPYSVSGESVEPSVPARYPVLRLDPVGLDWASVAAAVRLDSVAEKRVAFQVALSARSRPIAAEIGRGLTEALQRALVVRAEPVVRFWVWLLVEVGAHHLNLPLPALIATGGKAIDEVQAAARTAMRKARVINTLGGAEDAMVSTLPAEDDEDA